ELLIAGELSQRHLGLLGHFFGARRRQDEDGPRGQSTAEVRQKCEAYLVSPVQVVEDNQQGAAGREPADQLCERLEETQSIAASRRPRPRSSGIGKQRVQIARPRVAQTLEISRAGRGLLLERLDPQRERKAA